MAGRIGFRPSWGARLIGMEGLRAFAALGVLVVHVHDFLHGDLDWGPLAPVVGVVFEGLGLFFALSGFLLFRPFATAILAGGSAPDLRRYALNRALRIYPAYAVVLLLVSLVFGVAYRTPYGAGGVTDGPLIGRMTDPVLLLTDATLLHTLFPFSMKTGLEVAWSMSVEVIFYAVMPLLALGALAAARRMDGRRGGDRSIVLWALAPAAALLVVGVIGKAVKWWVFADLPEGEHYFYHWGETWYAVLARSFPVHADRFAFGMAAAVVVAAIEAGVWRPVVARLRVAVIGCGGLAVLSVAVIPDAVRDTALAAAFGALILMVALPSRSGGAGVTARALEWLPIRYVGLISYSVYLWHLPVVWFLGLHGWSATGGWGAYARDLTLVLAVTLALATVTYLLVERPALRLKRRTDAVAPLRRAVP